jgi:hypothetical protein
MNEKDAIKAAQLLFGSLGNAGRSGRKSTFNKPYVTDGINRTWVADTFEEALAAAELEAHPSIAHKVARKAFAARGNKTEICIAEFELVAIINEALEIK